MKIIFLLGNPSAKYTHTRHNAAWLLVDDPALDWVKSARFKAEVAEQNIDDQRVIYARPTTFYNLVGQSLRALIDYYKLSFSDVLVVHDDLMLPLGTVRSRLGGSDAGNNGLKSIAAHGGSGVARVRIGIATEARSVVGDTNFVLGKISASELAILNQVRPHVIELINKFIAKSFEATTYRQTSPED